MKENVIDSRTWCGKQVARLGCLSEVKLEFLDESSGRSPPKVIRIEFAGAGGEQILVRRPSDHERLSDSVWH